MKKEKTVSKQEITLNRKQIDKLVEFATNFKDVQWITLVEGNESGIGPSHEIHCSLFGGSDSEFDTVVDITDTSTW